MSVYKAIKSIARDRDKSIYRIEQDLRLSNGRISKWDQRMPAADTLQRVADYLGVTSAFILDKAKKDSK